MMEIFHQLTLLIAVRCSDSFFVHNREGDDKMSVENEKMQTDVKRASTEEKASQTKSGKTLASTSSRKSFRSNSEMIRHYTEKWWGRCLSEYRLLIILRIK